MNAAATGRRRDRSGATRLSAATAFGVLAIAGATNAANDFPRGAGHLYRDGPPPGFSGGFGEDTCQACHFTGNVNDGGGQVLLDGVPERYVPGESYPLRVILQRPGMALGGFQLTARFESGGAQAGELQADPEERERVAVGRDRGIQYAFQVEGGSRAEGAGEVHWTVLWTAPDAADGVMFNVSANAADGDDTAEGISCMRKR